MSESSFDDIAALTDRIYETVYDDSRWAGVMGEAKVRLGASSGAFGFVDAQSNAMHMLFAECQPGYEKLYFASAVANPFAARILSAPAGDVFIDQSVMPRAELEKTVFFNEWLRPQGEQSVLSAKILVQGDVTAHLTMFRARGQSPFDEHDISLARHFLPTLMRVTHLRTRVGALQLAEKADAYETLQIGFLVVNRDGQVLLANSLAEHFLAQPRYGIDAVSGQLVLGSTSEGNKLRTMIGTACAEVHTTIADADMNTLPSQGGGTLIEDPATGLPAASLNVVPLPDASTLGLPVGRAVVIFIQDLSSPLPAHFESRMRAIFGLTKKEAELAAALASGRTLKEAADERFISMPTVRTQLAQIFHKTNTSRQSQLVSLLLRLLPVR